MINPFLLDFEIIRAWHFSNSLIVLHAKKGVSLASAGPGNKLSKNSLIGWMNRRSAIAN